MPGNALIGNLAVNLTLETAAFQRGATIAEKRTEAMRSRFAAASKSVAGLGAALGVGIGVAALSNVARGAFEMASALSESAEKIGVSVEALQELRFAAQQTGVSEDQLATALNRLNKSMGELQLGKKGAVDAFAQIGLAADDLKGKAPEEALRIIADALNKLPDAQQRIAVGSQIMGKSFNQLLPLLNGGSKALDSYAEAARKAGIITSDEAKRLDDMADSWDRNKLKITVATAKIIAWFDSLEKGVIKWYAFRDKVLAAVGDMVAGIGRTITGKLNAIWDSVAKKIDWIGGKFRWLYDVVVGHSYVPDMVDEIGVQMARLDAVMVQPVANATGKTAEAFRALQENTRGLLDRLFPEASALNTLKSEMATLEAAMKAGILTADQYAAALNRLQTEGLSDVPILEGADQPLEFSAPDWSFLESQGTATFSKLSESAQGLAQAINQSIGQGISGLIHGFGSLKDVAMNVLGTIADFLLNSVLTSLNGPNGTGGIGGLIASVFGSFGGARASGGPVSSGKGYLVGENGPEWFSPGTSGHIISNDNLRGALVGGGQTFNIYAKDADSFRRSEGQILRAARRRLGV